MTTIAATPILSSVNAERPGIRLDTLLLRYPRWIHAELMTHRMFSRNASSSRAIPVEKLIQDVIDDPAMPLHWGKNQKGMQAAEELTGRELRDAKVIWEQAMNAALIYADKLAGLEAHKQGINRILEPFSHITVVVTSSNWSNFFGLRDHDDAEPHIRMLAQQVKRALYLAKPQKLQPGEWHLPFGEGDISLSLEDQIKKSVACCASTSYKTVEGFDMRLEKAVELHDKLVGSVPLHASPCEHVCQADHCLSPQTEQWAHPEQHGNTPGWRQYRKMLANECM